MWLPINDCFLSNITCASATTVANDGFVSDRLENGEFANGVLGQNTETALTAATQGSRNSIAAP